MVHKTALLLTIAVTAAQADYDPSAYPPHETCALCHGLNGVSQSSKFPNLGGQKPSYLEAQIAAFRSGARRNDGGQMSTVVNELDPEEFEDVVDWFSTRNPPAPYPSEDTAAGATAFAELGCAGCHDNAPDGDPEIPYLTAQHPRYLAKQMNDFRQGIRDVENMPGMHKSMLAVTDKDIQAIANYLAAEARP